MLVCAGNHRRAMHSTDCNANSSRSHAILTIYIESSNNSEVRVGKIHLVDLAGRLVNPSPLASYIWIDLLLMRFNCVF